MRPPALAVANPVTGDVVPRLRLGGVGVNKCLFQASYLCAEATLKEGHTPPPALPMVLGLALMCSGAPRNRYAVGPYGGIVTLSSTPAALPPRGPPQRHRGAYCTVLVGGCLLSEATMYMCSLTDIDDGTTAPSWRIAGYRGASLIRAAPPRRTLKRPYAQGPMVVLGGWVFLVSQVPL